MPTEYFKCSLLHNFQINQVNSRYPRPEPEPEPVYRMPNPTEMPRLQIEILIATMTGTAERVAQEIELTFADEQTLISLQLMDDLRPDVFHPHAIFIICTSTYGQGDVPDNGQSFFEALQTERPNLSEVKFAVLGLGDMTYSDTFNHGGMQFENLLTELGAIPIGTRAQLDANSGELLEDTGLEWMEDWLTIARSEVAG